MRTKTMYLTGGAACALVVVGLVAANSPLAGSLLGTGGMNASVPVGGSTSIPLNSDLPPGGGLEPPLTPPAMPGSPGTEDPREALCKKGGLGSGVRAQPCGANQVCRDSLDCYDTSRTFPPDQACPAGKVAKIVTPNKLCSTETGSLVQGEFWGQLTGVGYCYDCVDPL